MDINALLHDTNIWVAVSFVIFLAFAWKKGKTAILTMLDERITEIKQDIETAENLRIEAQELLAQYQRKQKDALKESNEIIDTAKKQSIEIQKNLALETENIIQTREASLDERIRRIEEKALTDIRTQVTDIATAATLEILSKRLDKKTNDLLVDNTIQSIPTNFKKAS